MAGNASQNLKVKRIRGDEELDTLIKGAIAGGGVIPHIQKSLINKTTKRMRINGTEASLLTAESLYDLLANISLFLQKALVKQYKGVLVDQIVIFAIISSFSFMARDFDPASLRSILPKAVSLLDWAIEERKGKVYAHCTAGLGRAPATAIAYMFWFQDIDLNSAYNALTSKRPCGPNKRAIRGATYDLAKNDPLKEPLDSLPDDAFEDVAVWERKLIQ